MYNNNQFDKAKEYYEKILLERKEDAIASFGLGATAFQQNDFSLAMKGFESSLNTDNKELKSSAYYKNILISAHGNSIRALCKKLFNLDNNQISSLEIPTGNPLVIELDNKQIGKQLGISEHTVKTHLRNIYSKTDTHNRTNLALSVLSSEQT